MCKLFLLLTCISLVMVSSPSYVWWTYTKTKYPIIHVHNILERVVRALKLEYFEFSIVFVQI